MNTSLKVAEDRNLVEASATMCEMRTKSILDLVLSRNASRAAETCSMVRRSDIGNSFEVPLNKILLVVRRWTGTVRLTKVDDS